MKKTNLGLILALLTAGLFLTLSGSSKHPAEPPSPVQDVPGQVAEESKATPAAGIAASSSSVPPTVSMPNTSSLTPAKFKDSRQNNMIVDEDGAVYPLRHYKALLTPNDPSGSQWWTAKTSLEGSWDIPAGTRQTMLAVIDTGFALGHEEFAGRWHENGGENGVTVLEQASRLNCTDRGLSVSKSCNLLDDNFDGVVDNESGVTGLENESLLNCTDQNLPLDRSCNLIDDDSNGLIDDWRGWDFINLDRSVQAGETMPAADSVGHGTMAAGIAAATGNNGKGISGVDWQTKILPLQALDDDGNGDTLTVSRAVRYAADQGADVISLSLGADTEDSYLRQAVQYAIKKGSLVVAASGNDGCECISYPARYPEVVAVGASDQNDLPTSFSNWGDSLDILAPGIGMTSSTWRSTDTTTAYANNIAGTSFATPFVAGLLTRAKSHQPNAAGQQLLAAITEQTNRLTLPANVPRNSTLGFGRANAHAAIARATGSMRPIQRIVFADLSDGQKIGSYEPLKPFMLYHCETSRPGTTTLYRLTKGSTVIYTISEIERQQAANQGYGESSIGSFCMNLPSDVPDTIRSLSVIQELENRSNKD